MIKMTCEKKKIEKKLLLFVECIVLDNNLILQYASKINVLFPEFEHLINGLLLAADAVIRFIPQLIETILREEYPPVILI